MPKLGRRPPSLGSRFASVFKNSHAPPSRYARPMNSDATFGYPFPTAFCPQSIELIQFLLPCIRPRRSRSYHTPCRIYPIDVPGASSAFDVTVPTGECSPRTFRDIFYIGQCLALPPFVLLSRTIIHTIQKSEFSLADVFRSLMNISSSAIHFVVFSL